MACGRRAPQRELLRFVRDADGVVRPDPEHTAPGRGAYLCAREECAERALSGPAAFARSFRAPVTIAPDSIQSTG